MEELSELESKIYYGEKLTEEELERAVCELCVYAEYTTQECNDVRVLKIKDKLFAIEWGEEVDTICYVFNKQPYEVKEKTEMVEIKKYVRK